MEKKAKEILDSFAKLLPVGKSVSFTEAERRAGEFLTAQAQITEWRHILSESKIKCQSVMSAVYAEELSKCTGKTVTENKTTVEANASYVKAREEFESIENDLTYLRSYYDIFQNAHVFYRQMAKGEAM